MGLQDEIKKINDVYTEGLKQGKKIEINKEKPINISETFWRIQIFIPDGRTKSDMREAVIEFVRALGLHAGEFIIDYATPKHSWDRNIDGVHYGEILPASERKRKELF
jgi:hypothetical protein